MAENVSNWLLEDINLQEISDMNAGNLGPGGVSTLATYRDYGSYYREYGYRDTGGGGYTDYGYGGYGISISAHPTSQTVAYGTRVTFSVTAYGGDTYQWYYATSSTGTGTAISGATSASYSFTAYSSGRYYYCTVSNSNGYYSPATSNRALLQVVYASSPSSRTVTSGGTATFSVSATISGSSYQWYYATSSSGTGTSISGATSSSYRVTGSSSNSGRYYYCKVTYSGISYTTSRARLYVVYITTNPSSKTIGLGVSVTFSAAASYASSYQWYCATSSTGTGTAISGATSASYTFTPNAADNGKYYYCTITYSGVSATSNRATLTVCHFGTNPSSQSVIRGNNVTFTVAASPASSSLQWYVAESSTATGTAISGATSASYTFTPSISDDGKYYYCVLTYSGATATSARASLAMMYMDLYPLTVCVGSTLPVGCVVHPSSTISSCSSSNGVISVDNTGNVTGAAVGSSTLTVNTASGLTGTVQVTVLAKNSINELESVFTNLAVAIRAATGSNQGLVPNQLANALFGITDSMAYVDMDSLMQAIADSIRTATNTSASITPMDMYKVVIDSIKV